MQTHADQAFSGKLTGGTRRDFIRGIAAAGASTATAVALERAGVIDLFADTAFGHGGGHNAFGDFRAIAPSSADALEVPRGFRADVLISWGDVFRGKGRRAYRYGFNNDFLAFFPLKGKDEGLLFVNHEYPDPFYLHGYKPNGSAKTPAQVQEEQDNVGNSILHIKRRRSGEWKVVSPSGYNRRIYGDRPDLEFTGPLRGATGIGTSAHGSLGNCSGGVTPWGTALSCEENFDGYGTNVTPNVDFAYGWHQYGGQPEDAEYEFNTFKKYGWVCEHDPYDPGSVGRKHTALGRFRHENTAFRHVPGSKFVLYMGDDKNNEGVYKFVSDRSYSSTARTTARFSRPGGSTSRAGSPRADAGSPRPATSRRSRQPRARAAGSGVETSDSTTRRPSCAPGSAPTTTCTSRPTGPRTSRSPRTAPCSSRSRTTRAPACSTRTARSAACARTATTRRRSLHVARLRRRRADGAGGVGFSSPDNLVIDKAANVWVVTDISSSRLNRPNEYQYHANNAMFMVPTRGPNKGVAFRFANGPVESEITGPYFSPDEDTLFIDIQHPGELTGLTATTVFGQETTYTSWWPEGNKTASDNPSTPRPSTVAISRVSRHDDDASRFIPPPPE